MRNPCISITLIVVMSLALSSIAVLADDPKNPQQAVQADSWLVERFRQGAMERNLGQAADLHVGSITSSYYPLTGQTLYHAKVSGVRTGRMVAISLDRSGQMVDGEEALQREEQARRDTYGKLDRELYELLQGLSGDSVAEFPVSIWLHMGVPIPPPDRPWLLQHSKYGLDTPVSLMHARSSGPGRRQWLDDGPQPELREAEVDAALAEESERVQAAVTMVTHPLLTYLLEQGWTVDYVSQYVPVVYATLSKQAILDVQGREDVQLIGLVRRMQKCLDVARTATSADSVWDTGLTGYGLRIGVIEVGGRAAVDNPYLWGVVQDAENACTDPQDHATAVTGMVRSRHVRYRGIAYGSLVRVGGSCEGWTRELETAAERAITWGAGLLNCSWGHSSPLGQPDSNERYWDTLVALHRATVCFAAGNEGREHGYIGHPAMAYNVVSVGAYNDQNTATWSDDTIASFSSYRDPWSANDDREKPEVTAPGVSINSTSVRSPWVKDCGSGTSYAAPMTTGAAALMIQANPELRAWPEAVKAILMATAWNNIEGDWWLSDKDGAGGIDIEAACEVARQYLWRAAEVKRTDFDANGDKRISIELPVADYARAVIVWCVDPNYANYPSRPQADFDLYYLDAQGNTIDQSESGDNNYELVAVRNVTGGRRTLRVHAWRIDTDNPIRFAWAVACW